MTHTLRNSGGFESLRLRTNVDLPALRAQLLTARLAMLAPSDRDLLERDPAAYASQRVGEILDPFDGVGLVPFNRTS